MECWRENGVSHAIVQYSSLMPQQLEVLAQAGAGLIEVEAYVYLYWGVDGWGQTPQARTRNALTRAQGRIRRLWLDCEDSAQPFQEQQLRECVEICQQSGIAPGIYTGRWWWVPRTWNSQAFAHLPLWHAEYLGQAPAPDLMRLPQDFAAFQPYGGWQTPAIWQWWNTTTFCGHSVDLNAIPYQPIEEDEMANLNPDGSQRIVAEGPFIVTYNGGVAVQRIGSTDGMYPGRMSKRFGGDWLWFRTLDDANPPSLVAPYWSPVEGD